MDDEGFGAYFDELLGFGPEPPAARPTKTPEGPGSPLISCELVPVGGKPPRNGAFARIPARSPKAEKSALAAVEKLEQVAPLREGDPLALGGERPKPPADPETYDPGREGKEFTRSLFDAETREQLRADGFFSIEEVRELVKTNSVKGTAEGAAEAAFTLDAELIILVDSRTNFKVFVTDDNVYTRDELYVAFPFQELGLLPEGVFARQEIGVFPPRKLALTEDLEYQARDVGDETVDFTRIEDLVGRAAKGPGYTDARPPIRVVKTKVFVGKERWKDFLATARVARCLVRSAQMQMLAPGVSSLSFFALGGAAPARASPLALMDGEQLAQEQQRLKAREAALEQRERELRQKEEEKQKKDEADQRRIREDIERLEAMMRAVPVPRGGQNGSKANGSGQKTRPAGQSWPRPDGRDVLPSEPAQKPEKNGTGMNSVHSIPFYGGAATLECDSVPLG